MSLLIILLTGLSTSSFFLDNYLSEKIDKNKHNLTQLNFALAHDNLTALRFTWEKSEFHSKHWLRLATKLAKTQGEVAYQLANYYQSQPERAIFWYKNAIRLKHFAGSIALAQYYFKQEKLNEATDVLATLPIKLSEKLSRAANILKINIAINQGNIVSVEQLINEHVIQLQSTLTGRLLLMDIEKYQLLAKINPITNSGLMATKCDNSIQLFATNLNHLKRLERLITEFKAQVLNQAVCFSPVRYLPINALDCNFEQDSAIRCDELNWQPWADTINTRYIGVMLPKGGANVHLGILYFDAQDSVDVVAHEISHLMGFIDEYPLVAEHVKCRSNQQTIFSQNISVLKKYYKGEQKAVRSRVMKQIAWAKHIKTTTPILHPADQLKDQLNDQQYWQLGTPNEYQDEVGVFNAQTCEHISTQDKNSFSAFKPLSQRTKLQYFALDFPPLYSQLILENPRQYIMPSFHYNIALAYFQQSDFRQNTHQQKYIEKANYWLKQAANWEQNKNRRKRVRHGKFE